MNVIEVAAGLIFRDGRLLITQRPAGGHLAGLWEFPGGKREPDESFEECLLRELKEELGIEVAVGNLIQSITHNYPGKTVHLRFFRCAWIAHEPRAIGCPAFQWISREQLDEHEFPAADAQLLEALKRDDGFWR